ncbi:hypothetical protein PAAG_11917 [Paracoccidioides lutzii Pb01]|uniref:Uncharacterized protein n=1 Tax=Paracoccidioides lutzii (strain ATCC MYA-826 / Pb01) TaxID=502779 RepID=A0A0A2V5B4_PARBA|nr:hypothetical protein PAAG_11917 [Paracoccidioides lutzii Pb01]KGQ01340.1 hypothetical protein PAAG_11917 [Paracoccidioides lutzii Pb01]
MESYSPANMESTGNPDSIHNIVNSTNLYEKLKRDDEDIDNKASETFEKNKKRIRKRKSL